MCPLAGGGASCTNALASSVVSSAWRALGGWAVPGSFTGPRLAWSTRVDVARARCVAHVSSGSEHVGVAGSAAGGMRAAGQSWQRSAAVGPRVVGSGLVGGRMVFGRARRWTWGLGEVSFGGGVAVRCAARGALWGGRCVGAVEVEVAEEEGVAVGLYRRTFRGFESGCDGVRAAGAGGVST